MNVLARTPIFLALAVAGGTALAQEDSRPLATRWAMDYSGSAEIGVGYVSDENFEFGEYNGLNEDEAFLIGNIDWSGGSDGTLWNFSGSNLGLDTRESEGRWRTETWELFFEYDAQKQVRNNTGRTPFRSREGGELLVLPEDWVSGVNTTDFATLDSSLRGIDFEIERDFYQFGGIYRFGEALNVEAAVSYEEREGNRERGAAIFNNAAAGDAVLIPYSVDEEVLHFDLAVNYAEGPLALSGTFAYNDFDNNEEIEVWQNPYANFGPDVRYPTGLGGMSEEPDNEYYIGRLMGTWIISPTLRVQVDGSYAKTEQDQRFLEFTVNEAILEDAAPLPRDNLDAELETKVFDGRVFWNPIRKLRLEGYFHGEERDFDVPRDGYQYVIGDAFAIPDPSGRIYNTAHSYSINTYGIEGSYPLPLRSKLWLTYEYEEIERDNSAVVESDEDRYKLRYRLPILSNLNLRFEALYGDRVADEYEWNQSYFARLDPERINATPDAQRYQNHPLLSQYHIATRERVEGRLDMDWQPGTDWNLALNLLYREDDYDETELGITDEELGSLSLTASWIAADNLVLGAWVSANEYESEQTGRAFRGGADKNAFEVFPPLPQASDPSRNWGVDVDDETVALGLAVEWSPTERLDLSATYSYQDTESDYDFSNAGASDLSDEPLPEDYETEMHHVILEGAWHFRDNLSVGVNYQYWNYDSDDWAFVAPNAIDKVLTLGAEPADEDLHYIGTSIIYRWQ
ncbi:MAG: MtrB/PioB family decaheme-associated outer membrane protein [Halieaceae bacterium]|nr:MtrB/PioB family decaheme-associated outer membrane protein [Halieaceae bacterium]